jgi:hypothetical protein
LIVPVSVLRDLIDYDADTGSMAWKPRAVSMFSSASQAKRWNARYAGMPALSYRRANGYGVGQVMGVNVYAHRVAWALARGYHPSTVDHINGDRSDNRICNLREVTTQENAKNMHRSVRNKSGCHGVCFVAGRGSWQARGFVKRKTVFLGSFQTREEAVAARVQWERENGYSENHGRRA